MKIFGNVQANSWRQSLFRIVLFRVGSACSCRQSTQESPATLSAAISAGSQGRQIACSEASIRRGQAKRAHAEAHCRFGLEKIQLVGFVKFHRP